MIAIIAPFTPLHGCLVLSALMFGLGLTATIARRSAILVLIGIELMLNAANINFIAFWRYPAAVAESGLHSGELTGPLFAMFSIAIAAAEAGLGLAIVFAIHRHYHTARLDRVNRLQG